MKVTKEDVEKAKAEGKYAWYDDAEGKYAWYDDDAKAAVAAAWNKYVKLKREYEDERQNGKDKQSRK